MQNGKITKNLFGGYSIAYECPNCQSRLKSPLDDAGGKDVCPDCGREYVVPGVAEREQIHRQTEQDEAEKKKRADEKRIATEEQRKIKAAEKARKERIARAAAAAERNRLDAEIAAESPSRTSVRTIDKLRPGDIICPNPNCGYVGPPQTEPRGNAAVGCLLCFIMLLPGLLYFVFTSGYNYICPRCGLQIRQGSRK